MNRERDWKQLKVGDRIRIVAIPAADQWQFETSGDNETYQILRRLAKNRTICTISIVDEYGYPWFEYQLTNESGKREHHSLTITDNESWVPILKSVSKKRNTRRTRV